MTSAKDFYSVLRVKRHASLMQIKRSYRKLGLQCHPDRVPTDQREEAEKIFKDLVETYFVLGHRERRKMYDQQQTVEENVYKTSDTWNFVDAVKTSYDKDTFESYFREQRRHSEVLLPDWRRILGGGAAKVLALGLIIEFFVFGQGILPALIVNYNGFNSQLPVPVVVAVLYILVEPVRDFFWEYIAEDEIYDISALLLCWLILFFFAFLIVSKSFLAIESAPKEKETDGVERTSNTVIEQKTFPVNLEKFNGPLDVYDRKHHPSYLGNQI